MNPSKIDSLFLQPRNIHSLLFSNKFSSHPKLVLGRSRYDWMTLLNYHWSCITFNTTSLNFELCNGVDTKHIRIYIWYFVTKIVLTYSEKKMFWWSRKTFEIQGWRPRICKIFKITRKKYSHSKRSGQFLVT